MAVMAAIVGVAAVVAKNGAEREACATITKTIAMPVVTATIITAATIITTAMIVTAATSGLAAALMATATTAGMLAAALMATATATAFVSAAVVLGNGAGQGHNARRQPKRGNRDCQFPNMHRKLL
jgi:hypothetical protein